MKHLTKKQINQMVYYTLNKKMLTDELVEVKRHMAVCDSCYEEFCVSIVAAYDLIEAGVVNEDILLYEEPQEERLEKKVFLSLSSMAGKIKLLTNDLEKNIAERLWNFVPEHSLAMARGDNNIEAKTFVNDLSEYSVIKATDDSLTIRLDDEYYDKGLYEAVLYTNETEQVYPFVYNELEECLEVIIKLETNDYRLEIRGTK